MEHDPDLRDKIITGAGELFMAQGYNATTIRQIADKVAIGRGHLYYYFKRKEDILLYLLRDMVQEINEREAALAPNDETAFVNYALNEYIYISVIQAIPKLYKIYKEAAKIQLLRNEYINLTNDDFQRYVEQAEADFSSEAVYLSSILASAAEFELMEFDYGVDILVEAVVQVRFSCLGTEKAQVIAAIHRACTLYRTSEIQELIAAQIHSLLSKYDMPPAAKQP